MAVTMNNDFSGMWPRVFWQVEIEVWVKYTALFIKAKEWKQCFDYLKDCCSKRPFSMYFFFFSCFAECESQYNLSKSDVWLTVHRNSVWIRKTN